MRRSNTFVNASMIKRAPYNIDNSASICIILIICSILARLLLIPFNESEEEIVEITSQLFQFISAEERISQKTSQLLPFILGMDKYFRDRVQVYQDYDYMILTR